MPDESSRPLRAALVAVQVPEVDDAAFAASLAELSRLGRTLGVDVVETITQSRASLHPGTVLGSGKLASLQALADPETAASPVEVVLVDHEITPSQARNLEKATGAEVLDRTAVILE